MKRKINKLLLTVINKKEFQRVYFDNQIRKTSDAGQTSLYSMLMANDCLPSNRVFFVVKDKVELCNKI